MSTAQRTCRCSVWPFPHRRAWQCQHAEDVEVDDTGDLTYQNLKRDEALDIAREQRVAESWRNA